VQLTPPERGNGDEPIGVRNKPFACAVAIPLWESVDLGDENGVLSRSLRRRYSDMLDDSA
jgi:hypothetical protein